MKDMANYLNMLEESLEKKLTILQALLEACRRQEELAEADTFDLDAFEETMDQKDALLSRMEELDEGFDAVFQKVKTEVKEHQEQYREEVARLQELIRKTTDISVEIQAAEERNKAKLSVRFEQQQREIRQVKTSTKVASTYYKSMAKGHTSDSYFMDQKK